MGKLTGRTTKLTEETWEALDKEAEKAGVTSGEYARMLIEAGLKNPPKPKEQPRDVEFVQLLPLRMGQEGMNQKLDAIISLLKDGNQYQRDTRGEVFRSNQMIDAIYAELTK